MRTTALMLAACLVAAPMAAAERPGEDDMFGAPAAATASPTPEPASTTRGDDAAELAHSEASKDAFASGTTVDNPLQMGGLYFQQAIASPLEGYNAGSSALTAPLLFDAFMDARPTERLRGFVQARLTYDPAASPTGAYNLPTAAGLKAQAAGLTPTPQPNPQVALDQAWLKFDVGQKVFVTAGRQHVKWGVGHYWNPTDFLTLQKLDPQQLIDTRLGTDMLRLSLPLPGNAAVTAIGLVDGANGQLGGAAGAARVEMNFGSHAEVGLDAITQAGTLPKYGADVSFPVGPIDAYAEAALFTGNGYSVPALNGTVTAGQALTAVAGADTYGGPLLQAVAGGAYDFAWRDNALGSQNGNAYPLMIFEGDYQPYYMGRNYVAGYLSAEGPDEGKHSSYNLSTICNLTDGSLQTRLDLQWALDTYLTFGAFGAAHYGTRGGEFNFAVDTPTIYYDGQPVAYHIGRTVADMGLSLRLGF